MDLCRYCKGLGDLVRYDEDKKQMVNEPCPICLGEGFKRHIQAIAFDEERLKITKEEAIKKFEEVLNERANFTKRH